MLSHVYDLFVCVCVDPCMFMTGCHYFLIPIHFARVLGG